MEHAGGEYAGKDGTLYHVLHASEGEIRGVPAGKYLVDDSGTDRVLRRSGHQRQAASSATTARR